ncbi:MAG: hypothetical protein J7K51_07815, partial [Thermotogae bacterium]|nr:hypothetical protein [Thermotogota bacterium]
HRSNIISHFYFICQGISNPIYTTILVTTNIDGKKSPIVLVLRVFKPFLLKNLGEDPLHKKSNG